MANGRNRWHHTSAILALLATIHRDTKKHPEPFRPKEFNPYETPAKDQTIHLGKAGIGMLKQVFVDHTKTLRIPDPHGSRK